MFAQLVNSNINNPADQKHIPIMEVSKEDTKNIKDMCVINRSEHVWSNYELLVLQHGLNFAITSNNIPLTDFITAIETACKFIRPDCEEAAHLRSKCITVLKQNKIPPSKISKHEREALEDL